MVTKAKTHKLIFWCLETPLCEGCAEAEGTVLLVVRAESVIKLESVLTDRLELDTTGALAMSWDRDVIRSKPRRYVTVGVNVVTVDVSRRRDMSRWDFGRLYKENNLDKT